MTDPTDADLRAAALKRFTEGMVHFPPEIIAGTGPGDLTQEATLKAEYARSGMAVVADELTDEYLHPMFEAHGVPNPEEYRLGYDLGSAGTSWYDIDITFHGINPAFLRLLGWWEPTGRAALDGRYRQRQRNRRRRRRA